MSFEFDDGVKRSFWRLFLRTLPFVPGPELYDLVKSVRRSQDDVDKQVQEAVDALSRSSALIDSLGVTLQDRERRLKDLQVESQRVSQLASLTADQAQAVGQSFEAVIGRGQAKERWISFGINMAAGVLIFLLGVFASDWVKSMPSTLNSNTSLAISPAQK